MPSPDETAITSDPEILAARGRVELAKAELESRLYQAGDTGKRALARMAKRATPVAIAAAALVGVVVITRAVRSRAKRRHVMPVVIQRESGPSFVKIALGAAVRAALRVLAARLAEQAAARLIAASDEQDGAPAEATTLAPIEPTPARG
jgi:hypothetical protein